MPNAETVSLRPVVDGFVGEIDGIDCASGLDADAKTFLKTAHDTYPVLVLRGQALDTKAFMRFGSLFGPFEIDHHVPQYQDKEHPEVVYLNNRRDDGAQDPDALKRGNSWHADSSYKERPCAHTVLYAMQIPSRGAGTHFADMRRAYETLPQHLKDAIEGREAKHKFSAGLGAGKFIPMTEEQEAMHPPVIHPMVRTHRPTGRKSLNVNPLHVYGIVGMDQDEATPLLEALFEHALNPDFQYLHDYRIGDLVIWDQRSTWHKAEATYSMDEHRLLMRAKIAAAA